MAVTGPFSRISVSNATAYQWSQWYRQTPPYRLRLNYEMRRSVLVSWYNQTYKDSNNPGNQSYNPLDSSPAYQPALDQAYERLKSALSEYAKPGTKETGGGSAQLGAALGERKQAIEMMTKRLTQIGSFYKSLRKGDVTGAAKALGVTWGSPRRKRVSNKKRDDQWNEARRLQRNARDERKPVGDIHNEAFDGFAGSPKYRTKWPQKPKVGTRDFAEWLADTFLEFHFGWEPMVKDIGAGMEALQSTFPSYTVRGRGHAGRRTGQPKQFVNDPNNGAVSTWQSRVQLICNVSVTNPNLWLANQLGFVNPVSVAWELVPFSFVVDWFTNVGAILAQATDFLGLTVENPATTHIVEHSLTSDFWSYYARGVGYVKEHYCMRRSTGLSKPALQLKPFQGFSLARGLTAASLLVQMFKGVK